MIDDGAGRETEGGGRPVPGRRRDEAPGRTTTTTGPHRRWRDPRAASRHPSTIYAGPDRRATGTAAPGWRLTATLVVVGGIALGPVVARATPDGWLEQVPDARVAAFALTLLLTLASQIHWKATGQAFGAHVAAAGWTVLASVAVPLLVAGVDGAASLAGSVVALGALSLGLTGPDVDPRVRPWRLISRSLLVFGSLLVLLVVTSTPTASATGWAWPLLGSAWWVAVLLASRRRARSSTSALLPWMVPFAAASAVADVALVAASFEPGAVVLALAAHLVALLVGTYAAITGLAHAAIAQRLEVSATHATVAAERQARDRAERERAHDVRTAILAIEGATATLRQHRDHLDATQRAVLDAAIVEGFRHLRGVATTPLLDPAPPTAATCDLAALVRTRVTLLCADGVPVSCDLGAATVPVIGDATDVTRVVDNLLNNALVHARRGARPPVIVVRLARDGATGLVRIEDDGPGVPAADREAVFAAGRSDGDGDGLGLHVARRLARRYGGEVTLSDSVLGGLSAQLRLPLAGAAQGAVLPSLVPGRTDQRTHLGQDGIQVRQFTPPTVDTPYTTSAN